MQKSIYSEGQEQLQKMLRNLRIRKGLRQNELARLLNVPQSFISKYESGERRLDILEVRTICKVMETDFLEFIAELDQKIHDG